REWTRGERRPRRGPRPPRPAPGPREAGPPAATIGSQAVARRGVADIVCRGETVPQAAPGRVLAHQVEERLPRRSEGCVGQAARGQVGRVVLDAGDDSEIDEPAHGTERRDAATDDVVGDPRA